MMNFQDCEEVKTDLNIVIKDPGSRNNHSKFRLCNPNQVTVKVIQIDDCVIKNGLRCDYLMILPNGEEFYIELKGSDVEHAVKQISKTIDFIDSLKSDTKNINRYCFIASTRCPINSTQIQILKKKFKQKYQARLTIKNGEIVHKL